MFLSTEKEARQASTFFARGVRDGYEDDAYKYQDRLVYTEIRVNPGGQYNKNTGEYRCEKTGVYYFTYSVYGYNIKNGSTHSLVSVGLMKDSVQQGEVKFSNDNTKRIYISLSQSLILQCNAGEKVWVESRWDNNYIYGDSDRNVFAGILLFMN